MIVSKKTAGALTEVIRDIAAAEVRKRLVRCHDCRNLVPLKDEDGNDNVGVAGCAACFTGIFAYCNRCGGVERAKSSVQHHVKWYASRGGRRFDRGHHAAFWKAYRGRLTRQLRSPR